MCAWFGTGGICQMQQCAEHGKMPKTTKALTCRWYSKRVVGMGSREETAIAYNASDEWISWFRSEWSATAKEAARLLEETAEV